MICRRRNTFEHLVALLSKKQFLKEDEFVLDVWISAGEFSSCIYLTLQCYGLLTLPNGLLSKEHLFVCQIDSFQFRTSHHFKLKQYFTFFFREISNLCFVSVHRQQNVLLISKHYTSTKLDIDHELHRFKKGRNTSAIIYFLLTFH